MGLLRGIVAVLALLFAFALGRALARAQRGVPKAGVASWAIRFLLTMLAVSWRGGLDRITLVAMALAAFGLALSYLLESRPRKQEDLSGVIFPHDEQ
jgi:hypothetical protein